MIGLLLVFSISRRSGVTWCCSNFHRWSDEMPWTQRVEYEEHEPLGYEQGSFLSACRAWACLTACRGGGGSGDSPSLPPTEPIVPVGPSESAAEIQPRWGRTSLMSQQVICRKWSYRTIAAFLMMTGCATGLEWEMTAHPTMQGQASERICPQFSFGGTLVTKTLTVIRLGPISGGKDTQI